MKLTKGKIIAMLCAIFGSLIGGIFDDFARQQEIKEAVDEYMADKEKQEKAKQQQKED